MARARKARLSESIRIKLAEILIKYSGNPRFDGITISKVDVAPDSSKAKVFYAVFNSEENIASLTEDLNKAGGFFQTKLARALDARKTPRLTFVFDKGFDHADRIDELSRDLNPSL